MGTIVLLNFIKLRICKYYSSKQTANDKVGSREGKSPDHKLRSLKYF